MEFGIFFFFFKCMRLIVSGLTIRTRLEKSTGSGRVGTFVSLFVSVSVSYFISHSLEILYLFFEKSAQGFPSLSPISLLILLNFFIYFCGDGIFRENFFRGTGSGINFVHIY